MKRLEGKVAIITGASGGIGAATAKRFAEEGAKVVLADIDEAKVKEVADSIGGGAIGLGVDVSDKQSIQALVDTASEAFGGVDIAVLNAGMFGEMRTVTDYPEELFDRVVNVNMKGVWHGLRAVVPEMRKRGGGSIVITSSTQGLSGYYVSSPYTASKHAVVGIMRNAAVELARENIRVNTVHPGMTDTQMMGQLHTTANPDNPDAVMDVFAQAAPIGRYADPREIANAMLFLASDESSYCTGSCLVADGGLLAYHGGPAPE